MDRNRGAVRGREMPRNTDRQIDGDKEKQKAKETRS